METNVPRAGFWEDVVVNPGKVKVRGQQDIKIVPEEELIRHHVDGA